MPLLYLFPSLPLQVLMELILIIIDLILLPSILLVADCILLNRRHARKETAASTNWFLPVSASLGQEFAVSDVHVYRGLRTWAGSKPWSLLFIYRSGLLKVELPLMSSPVTPSRWVYMENPHCRQFFTSLHKSLPGREISKVHFELSARNLPVICHGHWAITGTQSWRRRARGEVQPLQQDHHLCISHS